MTLLALLGLVHSACDAERAADSARKPNIVVIVMDDLGWGEVGYHGASVPTPSIDAVARAGIELDEFYAAPICSATRAALMTGRDPIRYGLGRAVLTPWRDFGLAPEEDTLAEVLGRCGYAQRGAFGKWHLGHLQSKWHPLRQGFTRFRGHYNGAIDYFTHERDGERDWHEGFEPLVEEGYSTDLIARAAAEFITAQAPASPFLCYVAFNAVHAPFQAPSDLLERFGALASPDGSVSLAQMRAAMITSLDAGVGVVLAALDAAGIAEDSVVWILSDNGAGPELPGANSPLRGNKLTLYEGGLRVPSALRWPRGLPAGVRCSVPLAVIDVLPTLLEAAGLPAGRGAPLDGLGMLAVLRGEAPAPERELHFYYGQEGPDLEQLALRGVRYKLIVSGPDLSRDGELDAHIFELFEIASDPFEEHDVAALQPDVVRAMSARLRSYRRLQPADGVAPFWEGSAGFEAPRHWRLQDD